MPQTTATPTRLPGFLRRSQRNPYNANISAESNVAQTPQPSPIEPNRTGVDEQQIPQEELSGGQNGSQTSAASLKTQPTTLSYRDSKFEKLIRSPVVNVRELRKLAWNGVPPQFRSDSWKILLGYLPANASRRQATLARKRADYTEAIGQHYHIDDTMRSIQEQETLRQVLVDVPRTAPTEGLFRDDRVRRCLEKILYIWAMRHPASSYVQGINDLVTPLFVVFLAGCFDDVLKYDKVLNGSILDDRDVSNQMLAEIEADCYWCLTKLLAGIQDHYTCDQPGVQRMVGRLQELVQRIDADLCQHLKNKEVEFMQFAFKWMNCLLLREFNLKCVIRLWDTYLAEGEGGFENFHVYVCAAFLCRFSAEIQTMEFDELFGFMQNIPTDDWGDKEIEVLLSQA